MRSIVACTSRLISGQRFTIFAKLRRRWALAPAALPLYIGFAFYYDAKRTILDSSQRPRVMCSQAPRRAIVHLLHAKQERGAKA